MQCGVDPLAVYIRFAELPEQEAAVTTNHAKSDRSHRGDGQSGRLSG